MKLLRCCFFVFLAFLVSGALAADDIPLPKIVRLYPLGGQRGTSVSLEILGEYLSNVTSVEFDCRDLIWTETLSASAGKLIGTVSIQNQAALGPHMVRVLTLDGPSTSALFNVGQFPSLMEAEADGTPSAGAGSNDRIKSAQLIPSLPVEVQGRLDTAADIDIYAVQVGAGQRWSFDFRSIEYGSAVEAKMTLLDENARPLAFNDDRNDFDETPFLEHTFAKDGIFYIKLDQYRGPRGFNFGLNCAYILRISALPVISCGAPLGARIGKTTRMRLSGTALDNLEKFYLTELRRGEYARMTYPYTMPVQFRADPSGSDQQPRIYGKIASLKPDSLKVDFAIPAGSHAGLWRLWGEGSRGISDGIIVELTDIEEWDEARVPASFSIDHELAINGVIGRPAEEDTYKINAVAGQPLHFWTLAAQLGGPHLDTVLQLRDAMGKTLAENDDVVAGQGTLIGNPDSSLFYTPLHDGPLILAVKDRVGGGGPSYQYRLKVKREKPGFQLFTTPENFTVARGALNEIKVHLIREAGFEGEVTVWFDGLPRGIKPLRGQFRADQRFEPNADGADMIIPEIAFAIQAPESMPPGDYSLQVYGVPAAEKSSSGQQLVQAQNTLIMGPLLDAWNFIRRPLPQISMTVVEPFQARLSTQERSLSLNRGTSATLEVKTEKVPEDSVIQVMNLPAGVTYKVLGRQGDLVTLSLDAASDTAVGTFRLSVQTRVGDRWAATRPFELTISAPQSSTH